YQRDRAPPRASAAVQRGAWHHAAVDRQIDRRSDVQRLRARLHDADDGARRARAFQNAGRARRAHRAASGGNEAGGDEPRLRESRRHPRHDQAPAESGAVRRVMGALQRWAKHVTLEVQEYVYLVCATAVGVFSRPFYYHDVVEQFDVIGWGSLTV